jgi:hypothetical protein
MRRLSLAVIGAALVLLWRFRAADVEGGQAIWSTGVLPASWWDAKGALHP